MVMILPFGFGIVAAVLVVLGYQKLSIITWFALLLTLAAWLGYHMTSNLNLAF